MKKVVCILLCCIVLTCTACGNNGGAFEQATAELADSTEQNVEEADEISGSILGAYKTFAEADEEAYRRVEEMTALGDYELLLDKAYSCESVVDTLQFAYDNYGQY